jgi:hypothetical protein
MSFNDLRKGYEEGQGKNKSFEPTREDKELLETKDIDTLTARAKLRLKYLRNKLELEKQLRNEERDSLSD